MQKLRFYGDVPFNATHNQLYTVRLTAVDSDGMVGTREGNRGTTLTPAWPAHTPTPALRTSHSRARYQPRTAARTAA